LLPITGIIGSDSTALWRERAHTCTIGRARKSEWIPLIYHVLAVLDSHPAPLLDRNDIERLLQVSPRQALRILVQLGTSELGKNLLIARDELIVRLRSVAAGEPAQYERSACAGWPKR
jgi:hypothetical protein